MKKIGVNTSNMIICTRRIFFYGIALMIPALWVLPANMDWRLMAKPVNAINLLYLGLFASALCFLTWNRVVEILGAVKSSIYIYMVPVVAVVAVIGTLVAASVVFWIGSSIELPEAQLLALTSGFFIYVAASDIIPEIHEQPRRMGTIQAGVLLAGLAFVGTVSTLLGV